MTPFKDRLAVCSWSLQPDSPQKLVEQLKQVGISRVQLALDPLREADRRRWQSGPHRIVRAFREAAGHDRHPG